MPYVLVIRERGSSWASREPIATIYPTREEAPGGARELCPGNVGFENG
jgi:hypothetical protein